MAKQPRLDKRSRELRRELLLAADVTRQAPTYGKRDPKHMRSPSGSVNSADNMRQSTHTNFRGAGAAYGVKTIHHGATSLGRVEARGTWKPQPPLPTDHALLRSLERGYVVPMGDPQPIKARRATAPMVKRFGKTK